MLAGQLRPGETLKTWTGVSRVISHNMTDGGEPVYDIEVEGSYCYPVGQSGVLVFNASVVSIAAPERVTNCCPRITRATATEFELVNPAKQSNFLTGELVSGGQLSFIIENLPKTTPPTGCPGKWMFQQLVMHFGRTRITTIQGNWVGSNSDNLQEINRLIAGSRMTIEQAAWMTWTGKRANELGFLLAELVGAPLGTPGSYTSVHVVFK